MFIWKYLGNFKKVPDWLCEVCNYGFLNSYRKIATIQTWQMSQIQRVEKQERAGCTSPSWVLCFPSLPSDARLPCFPTGTDTCHLPFQIFDALTPVLLCPEKMRVLPWQLWRVQRGPSWAQENAPPTAWRVSCSPTLNKSMDGAKYPKTKMLPGLLLQFFFFTHVYRWINKKMISVDVSFGFNTKTKNCPDKVIPIVRNLFMSVGKGLPAVPLLTLGEKCNC